MELRKAAWIGGILLLLGLNLGRDVTAQLRRFDWVIVEKKTLHQTVECLGVIEAFNVSVIRSQVDETVLAKYVNDGDRVKAGQPLMQLSQNRTTIEFEQQKRSYQSASNAVKKATRDLALQKQLFKNLAVSYQQVEDAKRVLEESTSYLEIVSKQFDLMKTKMDSTLVKSPQDGLVLRDALRVGQAVNAGTEIMTVGDTSKFVVRAKVDELDIAQVKPGQSVEIVADAFPDKVLKGVVKSVASQAEREAFAKLEVMIDLTDTADAPLKHNLSVRVRILTDDIPDSLGVPTQSLVQKKGPRAWVMLKTKLLLPRRKEIAVGRLAGSLIEVTGGLSEGESVGVPRNDESSGL